MLPEEDSASPERVQRHRHTSFLTGCNPASRRQDHTERAHPVSWRSAVTGCRCMPPHRTAGRRGGCNVTHGRETLTALLNCSFLGCVAVYYLFLSVATQASRAPWWWPPPSPWRAQRLALHSGRRASSCPTRCREAVGAAGLQRAWHIRHRAGPPSLLPSAGLGTGALVQHPYTNSIAAVKPVMHVVPLGCTPLAVTVTPPVCCRRPDAHRGCGLPAVHPGRVRHTAAGGESQVRCPCLWQQGVNTAIRDKGVRGPKLTPCA